MATTIRFQEVKIRGVRRWTENGKRRQETKVLPAEYFDDEEEGDFEEEWPFDCGMDRHGSCGYAGSEECEFECPYRARQRGMK